MGRKGFMLAVAMASALAGPATAGARQPLQKIGGLTGAQYHLLFDSGAGAQTRAQHLFYCFQAGGHPSFPAPGWLARSLGDMSKRTVWRDPQDGAVTEAEAWKGIAAAAYGFLQHALERLPETYGGRQRTDGDFLYLYGAARDKLALSLRALRGARLGGSLGGRGRKVIAEAEGLYAAMEAAAKALEAGREDAYNKSLVRAGKATHRICDIVIGPAAAARGGSSDQ